MTNHAVSNRADLRERTKTMSRHGDRRGQIADFGDSFETSNWLYLLFKCGIKTKTHFEWLLWHWSSLGQLNLEPTRPNGLVGCKVPTDLVKISVKEATHMGFRYKTLERMDGAKWCWCFWRIFPIIIKANLRDLIAATGLVILHKLDSNRRFFARVTLKFDGWPRKIIMRVFYTTSSFVYHFISISEFKLELQSVNAQSGSNSTIFLAMWTCNMMYDLEK